MTSFSFKNAALAGLLLLAQTADARGSRSGSGDTGDAGAVYVMTNRVSGVGNSVLVFDRNVDDGTLNRVGLFDTGGFGGLAAGPNGSVGTPSDALASQSSLILSESKRCLLAANAGSDTITSFRLSNDGKCLEQVDVIASGGHFPVSITQAGNTVFVLNAGNDGNVSGFRYEDRSCELSPLSNSIRSLNSPNTNPPFFLTSPSQVSITPDRRGLVATVKGTNSIHYWSLGRGGRPVAEQVITTSNGFTPFSFTFDGNDNLLVTEAFGASDIAPPPPTANTGAVSSYEINNDGTLSLISGSVPTGQTATCWIQYFGENAYTTNNENPNPSVSIFSVNDQGHLDLVHGSAANEEQGINRPIDLGLSPDGEYLYVLNAAEVEEETGSGQAGISVFATNGSGIDLVENTLVGLPLTTVHPPFEATEGVFGLAVF